ncbi:hypothetical protein Tco_0564865 [Tanacetum coccineum]
MRWQLIKQIEAMGMQPKMKLVAVLVEQNTLLEDALTRMVLKEEDKIEREKGHTKRYCPGLENQNGDEEARQNPDIVTAKEFDLLKWDQQEISLLEDMDSESAHMVAASKVPMLKPENGATLLKTKIMECKEQVTPITSAKDKAQRRLEVMARSTLMIGIPNEHQLKFNSIKDAESLLEAIKKRFEGNAATNKTQINLLKQQYENFSAPSSETLDHTFDRLQKLVSQLEILGEKLSQEDVNQKLLRTNAANLINVDNLSDDVICAFFASQPSSPQLANEDLQQLYPDDLEEIDLRWQMAMLTVRARRFLKNTERKVTINGNETIRFDKSKSDQAEEVPNYALMAYSSSSSDSEVSNDSTCSKSCLETVKTLKSQHDQLLKDFKKSELMVLGYKISLESVEERLEFYKKNKSIYEEKIKGLEWDIKVGEITIGELRKKLEKAQKEKDGIQINVDKFENTSKTLNKLIESQIVDNYKKSLGYNAVPYPYTRNFMPPKPDLSFTGLEEFTSEPVVIKFVVENSKAKASEEKSKAVRMNNGAPIIEDWVSDIEEKDVPLAKIEKKTFKSSFARGRADCNYHHKQFQKPRMVKPIWNNAHRVNYQNFAKKSHPCAKKNMVLKAVLMKSGLVSINTARQNISKTTVLVNTPRQVNTAYTKTIVNATRPMSYPSKKAHSTAKRHIHKKTTFKNSNFNQNVNTVKDKNVNTVRPKAVVNAARPKVVVNAVKGNNINDVKASACWVWKPKTKVSDHVSKHNSASITLKKFDYVDAQGRSTVMAWAPKRN